MLPSIENDSFFLGLLNSGALLVTKTGVVTNVKSGKTIGSVNGGYMRVGVKDHEADKIRLIQVHRLVWLGYKGKIKKGLTINHKDGNKLNNRLSNLEVATYSEQSTHAYRTGLTKITKHTRKVRSENISGEENPNSHFTDAQVIKYRKLAKRGKLDVQKISLLHDVGERSVLAMLNRKTYKHV